MATTKSKCSHGKIAHDRPVAHAPDKLAEAEKLIQEFICRFANSKNCVIERPDMLVSQIKKLLAAQDLISYERGREEQKCCEHCANKPVKFHDVNEFYKD